MIDCIDTAIGWRLFFLWLVAILLCLGQLISLLLKKKSSKKFTSQTR